MKLNLLSKKQIVLLRSLRESFSKKNITQIAKQSNMTYSHVVKLIPEFEARKLIRTRKEGRQIIIEIMPKGKKLLDHLTEIEKILGWNRR